MPDNSACTPLQDVWPTHQLSFDVGQQHLSLSVPQIYVGRMARGYVSPDLWEEGINAGLLNYSFNEILLIIVVTIMQENQTMHI